MCHDAGHQAGDAYIITLVAGLLATYSITSIPLWVHLFRHEFNELLCDFSLLMVFFVAYFSFDIASMARHEKLAMERDYKEEVIEGVKGKVRNLILPILVLITVTVFMMIHTGSEALAADGKPFSILGAFENTTVGISLVVGGSSAVAMSTLLIILERQVSLQEYGKAWIAGIKSMLGAIAILFFAWTINKVVVMHKPVNTYLL